MSVEREMGGAGFHTAIALILAVCMVAHVVGGSWWALWDGGMLVLNAWWAGKAYGRALQLRRW